MQIKIPKDILKSGKRRRAGTRHAGDGGTRAARKRKIALEDDRGKRGRALRQTIRMGVGGIRAIEDAGGGGRT